VTKRDGRLVPFDADRISQGLFAASEALGRPDAFLARELTDGVLHFLALEAGAGIPTTALVGELVVKVVRELGQPALAQVFAAGSREKVKANRSTQPTATGAAPGGQVMLAFSASDSPGRVVRECLRAYSLHAVFARDLAAAHRDGLLTLTGLESPLQLAACVLGAPASAAAERTSFPTAEQEIAQVRCADSPEQVNAAWLTGDRHATAAQPGPDGRPTIVNLNCRVSPLWAEENVSGPLFGEQRRPRRRADRAALAEAWLEEEAAFGHVPGRRIHWHLAEEDFCASASSGARGRLLRLARRALELPGLAFVFDRRRRPIALGEGLDRQHAAVLLSVGLHLPRLAVLPGVAGQANVFLQKLGSLARLALSAAAQKRAFLRRQGAAAGSVLARGFLLERARLVVVPVGLDAVVRGLTGCALGESKAALDIGRQIVLRLREVLEQDGRRTNLDSCIDGLPTTPADGFMLDRAADSGSEVERGVTAERVAGLTPWAPEQPAKSQLRAASVLHAAAEGGTAAVFLSDADRRQLEVVANVLHFAWQQTDVVRLRFVQPARTEACTLLPC
jgi:hypothetical protein